MPLLRPPRTTGTPLTYTKEAELLAVKGLRRQALGSHTGPTDGQTAFNVPSPVRLMGAFTITVMSAVPQTARGVAPAIYSHRPYMYHMPASECTR